MVIPILPNTHYAKGRAPVRSRPSFPFPNCFHWIECELTVRIACLTAGAAYDYSHAIRLSARQQVAMERKFNPDYLRLEEYRHKHEVLREKEGTISDAVESQPSLLIGEGGKSDLLQHPHNVDDICVAPLDPDCNVDDFLEEAPSEAPGLDDWGDLDQLRSDFMKSQSAPNDPVALAEASNPSEKTHAADPTRVSDAPESVEPPSVTSSLRDFVLGADLFGEQAHKDPTIHTVPLVRVWLELEEHLTAETIPSPEELFSEVDAIEM